MTYCVRRPLLWRTLVTVLCSKGPLRAAARRRASPLQSGAAAQSERRGREATLQPEFIYCESVYMLMRRAFEFLA